MPAGQFEKPQPNKVIAALQKLGNQRPVSINLRTPRMSQDYLGTYLGPEVVDANLSLVRLHGGATIRFVPRMDGLTLVAGDIVKLQESSAIKLHIVGKIVGNITLAFNQTSNVAKPTAPTSYVHGTVGSTTVNVTWVAGTDHFGSGLTYQIYVNGKFNKATASNATSAQITGLSPGTAYTSFIVSVDGAGNQSANSSAIGWTTTGTPVVPGGTTVTTRYNAIGFRSYNYNGNFERDDWHDGNAYQGAAFGAQNQLGLIFFNDQAIRNDLANNTVIGCKVTITFAHWRYSSGGRAAVGPHQYRSGHAPGTVSTSKTSILWHVNSVPGKAFTIDMGPDIGDQFRTGFYGGVNVGQSEAGTTHYGYTYGLGTHVPYLTFTYIKN